MQFGLAEIIGSTGVLLATGVGIFQIWLAYAQLRTTKKSELQTNEPTDNDKSTQDNLIQRAISHQLQGNLQEAMGLVEKAKELPFENPQLFVLERQLRTELKETYVDEASGKVVPQKLFSSKSKSKRRSRVNIHPVNRDYDVGRAGCASMPALTIGVILKGIFGLFLGLTIFSKYSVLAILLFTGLIYLLLKWSNF